MLIWYRLVNLEPGWHNKIHQVEHSDERKHSHSGYFNWWFTKFCSAYYKIIPIQNILQWSVSSRNPGTCCQTNNLCMYVCISQFPQREPRVWYVYIQIFETKCVKTICKYYSSVNRCNRIKPRTCMESVQILT